MGLQGQEYWAKKTQLVLFLFLIFLSIVDSSENKFTTAESSPRKFSKSQSKRRSEVALYNVGLQAAAVAVGFDIGQFTKDASVKHVGKSDKQSSRRRHEASSSNRLSRISSASSRLSWLSSMATEETSMTTEDPQSSPEAELSPQDLMLASKFPPSEFGLLRGSNKRPLSTPVLLKATFFRESQPPSTFTAPSSDQRSRSSSTTSACVTPPALSPLIDLAASETRERRSGSLNSQDVPRSPRRKPSHLNLDTSDVTLIGLGSPLSTDARRRLSSPEVVSSPDVWKLPPPPHSPRTNSPMSDGTNHHEPLPAPAAAKPLTTSPLAENKVSMRPRPRPRQGSLSPSSDKETLSLLDSPAKGQFDDPTRPLLRMNSARGHTPSMDEIEKEFCST